MTAVADEFGELPPRRRAVYQRGERDCLRAATTTAPGIRFEDPAPRSEPSLAAGYPAAHMRRGLLRSCRLRGLRLNPRVSMKDLQCASGKVAERRLSRAAFRARRRPVSGLPGDVRGLANCTKLESPRLRSRKLHGGLEAGSGSPLDMAAVAELVCQACGTVSWSTVPRRTGTMPACPCGGPRPILRLPRRPRRGDRPGAPNPQRARGCP